MEKERERERLSVVLKQQSKKNTDWKKEERVIEKGEREAQQRANQDGKKAMQGNAGKYTCRF